ncbi:MAG: hypothetical protein K2M06_00295 [Muribaculaceae bacterium]|nr:hypothetical protein [Muribaculaceae bacterium]
MTDEDKKRLRQDQDGLLSYEYLANNISTCTESDLRELVDIMRTVDLTGQFLASAARYLHAIDAKAFDESVRELVAATIDKDREHKYLPSLLMSLYGDDCLARSVELCASDDNFRRIYKRLYPEPNKL